MLFECPYCKAKCQFSKLVNQCYCQSDNSYQQAWVCSNCNGVIVSRFTREQDIRDAQIFPLVKIKPKIKTDKLPDNIRNDYLESLENYSNGCYTSSVIMSRRVIQQSCIEKGAKKENLFGQIEELKIDDNLKKLAHKLRYWGNKGAHPDILLGEKIEEKDAKVAIDFTEKFLQYVYVIPKEIEEIEGEVEEKIE
ncbi:MAG: DUF4145 domain-containing protein [Candidatus Pacebacteria bacterium]|nr:DUF4145 domain-containing protein [Candidatus Paceibacterota bacterium]